MKKKSIITTATAVALVMSSMVPALAATNSANDPTAAQVQQALLNFYSTQKVWPYHLLGISNTDQNDTTYLGNPPAGTQWDSNHNDWVGLKTVFPGQPATAWPKLLGMDNAPAGKPITAGTLAQWILNWEEDARAVKLVLNGRNMYPTNSAFGLMQLYSVFYGTNITSPKTVINQHDLQMVIKNMTDLSHGYRLLAANKVELLLQLWGDPRGNELFAKHYPQWWADAVKEADSVTFTFHPNGSVTYDRAHYAGLVMLHAFGYANNGYFVSESVTNLGTYPSIQVSGKVPFTVPLNSGKKYSPISETEGPNSLDQHWQPFDGTFFYASFQGPSNETTIANDTKIAEGTITGLPNYFIQVTHGRIENVLFNNEMNSYPLQEDTDW